MSHQCPFPVRSTDNRNCYKTGSAPGFVLCLTVVAALLFYADFGHAQSAPVLANSQTAISGTVPAIDNPGDPLLRS